MAARTLQLAALGAGLWLGASCAPSAPTGNPAAAQAAQAPREVQVAVVEQQVWERLLHLTGELAPAETATLSSKVAGRLAKISVDVGSVVHKDECVAAIDGRDFELRLAQARANLEVARAQLGLTADDAADSVDVEQAALVREARANLDQAKLEFERQTSLITHGATTQSAVDQARTEASAAESRWQSAKETIATRRATLLLRETDLALAAQQLADTQVLAPFDGVVAARLAGSGDYLTVGDPLARVLRSDPVRLKIVVPEQYAGAVRAGQELRAHFDSGAPDQVAHIARLAPALGANDRTLGLEADIPNPAGVLRPGSFVRADLVLDPQATTLVIPPAALVRFAGIDKVFLADNGKAVERRVKLGRTQDTRIEVLEGLQAGDSIVLDPGKLQADAPISVGAKD